MKGGIPINIEKKRLDDMIRSYSVNHIKVNGIEKLFFASEAIDGACYAYSGENFDQKEVVWETDGGTMSIIEIPDTDGQFLAVQKFFPGFNSAESKLVWARFEDDTWKIQDFLKLPYLHRFDILVSNGKKYFIGCTLCGSKKDRNDWSDPGKIWVGEIPEDLNQEMKIHPIKEGLVKNHGYSKDVEMGQELSYVTCDLGIYKVTPPHAKNKEWTIEQILDQPTSDLTVFDMDGDGEKELVVMAPFHGNEFKILKKINGEYSEVYRYPHEIDFAHALWAGNLRGRPTILGGIRRKDEELFYVQYDEDKKTYDTTLIEKGVGPANLSVLHQKDQDVILSANHTKNEVAIYLVTD